MQPTPQGRVAGEAGPRFCPLVNVLPERGVQAPGEDGEHAQEQQHPDADAHARILGRLAHPLHEADQVPDRHIAWRSVTGAMNAGSVMFQPAGDGQTKVTLELTYEPRDATEKVGDALGFLERRVSGDLERFKKFIESRGAPTGAWRGEIHGANVDKR